MLCKGHLGLMFAFALRLNSLLTFLLLYNKILLGATLEQVGARYMLLHTFASSGHAKCQQACQQPTKLSQVCQRNDVQTCGRF
jgi:hypothetical protein